MRVLQKKLIFLNKSMAGSQKLSNAAKTKKNDWIQVVVVFILLSCMAFALALVAYLDNPSTANTDIRGSYEAVTAASTSPILGRLSLRTSFAATTNSLDGVTINIGDTVLLKDELNSQNNGLYVFTENGYERSPQMNQASQVTPGNIVYVNSGTINGGSSFMLFDDPNNSSGTNNEVTGEGIIYKNSNSVILGIDTQNPPTGSVPSYDPNFPTLLKWTSANSAGFVKPENGTGTYPANSVTVWSGIPNEVKDSGTFINPSTGEVETPSIFLDNVLHIEPFAGPLSTLRLPDNSTALVGQSLTVDTILPGPIITTKWETPAITMPDNGNIVYVKTTLPLIAPYEYNSIQLAINYVITQSPSATHPWQIWIYPGVYNETNLVVPSFVNISGTSQGAACIMGNALSASHIFTLEDNSALYSLTIQGPTQAGFAGVYVTQADFAVQMFNVTITGTDIGLLLENGNGNNVFAYLNDCAISEPISRGIVIDSTGSPTETVNYYGFSTSYYAADSNPIAVMVELKGAISVFNSVGEQCERDPPVGPAQTTFLEITDGGSARITGLNMLYFLTGISIPNDGSVSELTASGIDFFQCTQNIDNQNPLSIGYFAGETEFDKTTYPINGQWFIANKNPRILTVGNNMGSDFQDVKSALDSIVAPSSTNRFIIMVAPGIFPIPVTLQMQPYVTIRGNSQSDTILQAVANVNMINMVPLSGIQNLNLVGVAGSTHTALVMNTPGQGQIAVLNVIIQGHPTCISITNPSAVLPLNILISQCLFATSNQTVRCIDISSDRLVILNMQSCLFGSPNALVGDPFQYFLYSDSAGGLNPPIFISLSNMKLQMSTGNLVKKGTAFGLRAGTLSTIACSVTSFSLGLEVPNSMNIPQLHLGNFMCDACTQDINVINPNTIGNIAGNLGRSKVTIPTTANIAVAYIDAASGITLTGQLYQGPSNFESTNITRQIQQGSQLGLISGGDISVVGLTVSVTAGDGYIMQGIFPNDWLHYVTWVGQSTLLPTLQYTYVFIDINGTLQLNAGPPNLNQNVFLGTVLTDSTGALMIQEVPKTAVHLATGVNSMLNNALGPVFVGGCIVSFTGVQLSMIQGSYYLGNLLFSPSAKALLDPFLLFFQNGTLNGWQFVSDTPASPANQNVPNQWDNGSGTLQSITAGSFIKHLFYVIGDGVNQKYALVYAQQQFASLGAAIVGALPTSPPFLIENAATIAAIIVNDVGAIVEILDERPSLSFKSGTLTSTANHSSLTNLAADDHKQYLLGDGSRAMTGNLDLGGFPVINGGLYNGVDVEDHHLRHNKNGLDPLDTGVPVSIGTANAEGVAFNFSRSDHVHNHGAQTDPTQHAIATTLANGFMSSADKTKLDNSTDLDVASTLMQRSATGTFQSRAHTLFDSTGVDSVTLSVATGTTSYTLTLPPNDGTLNQVLVTDGTGVTSWTSITPSIITGVLPIANGGTNSSTALVNNRVMISNGGAIVESSLPFNIAAYSLWANSTNAANDPTQVTLGQGEILARSGTTLKLAAGTAGQVLTCNGGAADVSWTSTSSLIIPFVIYFERPTGIQTNEVAAAATWNTRLFSVLTNPTGSTAVSIAGTVGVPAANFTLAAGTWMMSASAPAYRAGVHKIRLVTSAAPTVNIFSGSSEFSANSANTGQTRSILNYTWTIPAGAPITYRLQHYTQVTGGGVNGTLGQPTSIPLLANQVPETYGTIHLLKLA